MSKFESFIISIALHVLCPILIAVLFWWSAAAIFKYQAIPITERAVAISAITGLAVGMILDFLYVRTWIPHFYTSDLRLTVLVYLFCSAIATAFCMGLPAGNLFLGILAGLYIGRRSYHSGQSGESFPRLTKRASVFTALVTGTWTVAIGTLALGEPIVRDLLTEVLGFNQEILAGLSGVTLVLLSSAVLMVLQYWLTNMAARMSFTAGAAQPV